MFNLGDILDCPRLIRWFAVNCDVAHEKVEVLPIGLENYNHYRLGMPNKMAEVILPQVGG
jgi:hypothetical protein